MRVDEKLPPGRAGAPATGSDRWRFAVAPMMDWTDRHCRAFHRVLSKRARLYTEMITAGAVIHGNRERLLGFDAGEHPLAVQLGGSDPGDLARAARICADRGYGEINLNVGCPSDRVRDGAFGACLMREPALVGDCVAAMKAAVAVPVTVKCRIGVDEQEPRAALDALADAVVAAGADALIVHARKAWLGGLSPKENRTVPPLDYPLVHALKRRLPHVPVALNGGLAAWPAIEAALGQMDGQGLDGVMVGRAAYGDPALLLEVDTRLFGATAVPLDRREAIEAYLPTIEARLGEGVPLHAMTRHVLGLFNGWPGARAWRRHLATEAVKPGAGLAVVRDALRLVRPPEALAA